MDLQKMLKEAEALQKTLLQAQSDLENIEVKGTSGNGLVEVLMNAKGKLKNIQIKKEAVDPNDIETLEDLVLSAFRDATDKAESVSREKMTRLTGNKSFPGLF